MLLRPGTVVELGDGTRRAASPVEREKSARQAGVDGQVVRVAVHTIRPEGDHHIWLKGAEQVEADRIELGPTLGQLAGGIVRDDHVTDSQAVGAGDGTSP